MKIRNLLKNLILAGIFIFVLFAFTGSANSWPRVGIVINPAPMEVIPVRPGPRFRWIRGHYRVGFRRCMVWVPGHWKRF